MSARTYDLNGYFEVRDNPISREGVFPYSGAQIGAAERDRIFQVYRPAAELGDAEALASFRLLPIIDDHTMLGEGFTPAEQVGVHGVIGEDVRLVDGVMTANLKIFSSELAEKIKRGKTELSCGYRCAYDFTPGEWNGQKYDVIQRQIRGNHLALVDEGRMGPTVAILDHMVFTVDAKEQGPTMDEELKKLLASIMERLDKLEAAKTEVKAEVEDETKEEAKAEAKDETAEETKAEAKDEDESKAMAKDEESEEAKKEAAGSTATDALTKEVKALAKKIGSIVVLDEAAVVQTLARKTDLANRLSAHIGTFDHSAMTFDGVVKYGLQKLGIKNVPAGTEAVALDAALQARPVPSPFTATDSAAPSPLGKSIAAYAGK